MRDEREVAFGVDRNVQWEGGTGKCSRQERAEYVSVHLDGAQIGRQSGYDRAQRRENRTPTRHETEAIGNTALDDETLDNHGLAGIGGVQQRDAEAQAVGHDESIVAPEKREVRRIAARRDDVGQRAGDVDVWKNANATFAGDLDGPERAVWAQAHLLWPRLQP